MKKYPDVTEIFAMKERHRRALAALPFEKKIEIVFKLRERRDFIKSGQAVDDPRGADTIAPEPRPAKENDNAQR